MFVQIVVLIVKPILSDNDCTCSVSLFLSRIKCSTDKFQECTESKYHKMFKNVMLPIMNCVCLQRCSFGDKCNFTFHQ